jgi:glycosyltransferase involved in cell wall biosynthesis
MCRSKDIMTKKKVLHIIDSLEIGGAEKLLVKLINELDGLAELHLILLCNDNPLLVNLTPNCKVTIFQLSGIYSLPSVVLKVRKYIKLNNIEIVHTQLYISGIIARLASPKKFKVINTIQAISSEASYKINFFTLWVEKITYKKRHIIIGVSKTVLDDFDKWVGIKGKNYVFYNIIEDKFFTQKIIPKQISNNIRLVSVGNLRLQKNYIYLIEAFKKLPTNVSLDIYGEGLQRNEFEKIINEFKLNIRLCGHSSNLENELKKYDYFVMSSLYEGFSLGLMEAMACGLPPLLSDIPVLKEAGGDVAIYFDLNNVDSFVDVIAKISNPSFNRDEKVNQSISRAKMLCNSADYVTRILTLYEVN